MASPVAVVSIFLVPAVVTRAPANAVFGYATAAASTWPLLSPNIPLIDYCTTLPMPLPAILLLLLP